MAGYKYLNVNSQTLIEPDCVCRAITLATGIPYDEVKEKLWLVGELLECEPTCLYCYRFLIEDVYKITPIPSEELYPAEFADKYPEGTYMVRMEGHILTIIDGVCYDIFDSRYYGLITDAWRVD